MTHTRLRIAAFFSLLLSSTIYAQTADELIRDVSAVERRLLNITVVARGYQESQVDEKSEHWKAAPGSLDLTMWHDGSAGGPMRADVSKELLPWTGGPAGVTTSERSYSASFNGTQWKMIRLTNGPENQTMQEARATVLPRRPDEMNAHLLHSDGSRFSIFFFNDSSGQSLSQYLRSYVASGVPISLSSERVDGQELTKLQCGSRPGTIEYFWLDANRGYALVRHRVDGVQGILFESQVTKLEKVGEGIWYPVEATYWSPFAQSKSRGPKQRWHYSASRVLANEANFDRKIFDVAIPPYFKVDDKVSGKVYLSGKEPESLAADLDAALKAGLSAPGRPGATQPAGVEK